jgi:hypothetical protein
MGDGGWEIGDGSWVLGVADYDAISLQSLFPAPRSHLLAFIECDLNVRRLPML